MTLRVGNLTLSYLKKGAKDRLTATENKEANIAAIKSIHGVVGSKFKAQGNSLRSLSEVMTNLMRV